MPVVGVGPMELTGVRRLMSGVLTEEDLQPHSTRTSGLSIPGRLATLMTIVLALSV